mmetsp:Transcript_115176/g.215670  ORF Transcript_115176/g.215670 Transcript_115176/m.215670 type:complete len:93 (-) Transcript_115176:61-339(-)
MTHVRPLAMQIGTCLSNRPIRDGISPSPAVHGQSVVALPVPLQLISFQGLAWQLPLRDTCTVARWSDDIKGSGSSNDQQLERPKNSAGQLAT